MFLVMFVFWLFLTRIVGYAPTKLEIPIGKSTAFFETTTGNRREYVIAVQPQGWQKTGILLGPNDKLSFEAEGKICVDLWGLMDAINEKHMLEEKYREAVNNLPDNQKKGPEFFFNEGEMNGLRSKFDSAWIGPAGLRPSVYSSLARQPHPRVFPSREKYRLMPEANLGALIGAIKRKNEETLPAKEDIFLIGNGTNYQPKSRGELWLNVNDVVDKTDEQFSEQSKIFYFDNAGFYWVKIIVE